MNKKTKAGVIAAVAGAMGVSGVAHMDAIKHAVKKQSDITAETKIPVLSSLLQSKKSTEARGVTTTSDVARKRNYRPYINHCFMVDVGLFYGFIQSKERNLS